MENVRSIVEKISNKISKYKKIASLALLATFSVEWFTQDISHQVKMHAPYRIGFTGASQTEEAALQRNTFVSNDKILSYYELTLGFDWTSRHEIGIVKSLLDGNFKDTRKELNVYWIYFHAKPNDDIIVSWIDYRQWFWNKNTLLIEWYPLWDMQNKSLLTFSGLKYTKQIADITFSLKQNLLTTTSEVLASPLVSQAHYSLWEKASLYVSWVLNRKNFEDKKASVTLQIAL